MKVSISPGKTVIYVVCILFAILPAFFTNSIYGYLGILFILFFSCVSLLYSFYISHKVIWEYKKQDMLCVRDKVIDVELNVKNTIWLPTTVCTATFFTTDLFGNTYSTKNVGFILFGKEDKNFGFKVALKHIGFYTVGLESIQIDSILGTVSFKKKNVLTQKVTVTPKTYSIENMVFLKDKQIESKSLQHSSNADNIDYTGVREYAIGDPIKLIHWNLSSHTGNYVTKLMESYGNDLLSLIVANDFITDDIDLYMTIYDLLIETTASLCEYTGNNGIETYICYYKENKCLRKTYNHSSNYAELINMINYGNKNNSFSTLDDLLDNEIQQKYNSSNIGVITSVLDEASVIKIISLHQHKKNVMVFYISPYEADDNKNNEKFIRTILNNNIELHVLHSINEIEENNAKLF